MYISLKIVDSKRCGVPLPKEFWLQFDMDTNLRPPLQHLADEARKISRIIPSILCFIYTSENKAYLRLLSNREELESDINQSLYAIELTPESEETTESICIKLKQLLYQSKSLKDEIQGFFKPVES